MATPLRSLQKKKKILSEERPKNDVLLFCKNPPEDLLPEIFIELNLGTKKNS